MIRALSRMWIIPPNKVPPTKKTIDDIYSLVKSYRKISPKDVILVRKNGRIWFDKLFNRAKYDARDIIGNLETIYKQVNNITDEVGTKFRDQKRREFYRNIETGSDSE